MSGATSSFLLKGESSLRSSESGGGNVDLQGVPGLTPETNGSGDFQRASGDLKACCSALVVENHLQLGGKRTCDLSCTPSKLVR